ncbi:hypothetical protein [Shimazuella alba]|uniref:Uncharacterized protein n=1 Tax=Shimazuella alba TaxID=2690964 RepID=A0A6I4VPG7_9BACL|nr:hypothetical protein [Shimazuella alba]MXQ52278.1 hypothetical protein [Shimazuella alba]
MDPKKALEGFRVDAIVQKELPSPKQKSKQSNVILIIFVATMLGLSTGIGSAFAFGTNELQPSQSPLDEPTSKSHLEQKAPLEESHPKTSELAPLKPPIDEPIENISPIDEPIKEDVIPKNTKQTDSKDTAPKDKEESKTEQHKKEKPVAEKNTNTSSKPEPKASVPKPVVPDKKPETSKSVSTSQQSSTGAPKDNKQSSSSSMDQKQKSTSVSKETGKSVIVSKGESDASTSTQSNSKSIPPNDVAVGSEETPDPKTKPGKLPDTAGDELNHALACLVLVCFSIAYLLAKKETHPEN